MWITERKHAEERAAGGGASAADVDSSFESYVQAQREAARAVTTNMAPLYAKRDALTAELRACEHKRHLLRRAVELRAELDALKTQIEKRASGEEAREMEAKLQPYIDAYAQLGGGAPTSEARAAAAEDEESHATDATPARTKRTSTGAVKKAAQPPPPPPGNAAPVLRQSRLMCDASEKKVYHKESIRQELQAELEQAPPPVYVVHGDMCEQCNVPMIVLASEALLGCPQCSRTRLYIQATSSRIAYGEEVEFANFSYKRQNHFQEWLNTFQAKESTEVPQAIIDAVMEDLYAKKKVRDVSKITQKKVKEVLKDLKLRKYYDHAPQITARITGVLPPRMTPFQAEQTKLMFAAIQGPFNMHCPPERTNFLSYGYCLYKFCELLGYDEFLPCFPLLKGKDKLAAMDRIWRKICGEINWQFIPSC